MYRLSCLVLLFSGVFASDVDSSNNVPPQYESALASLRKAEDLLRTHLNSKKLQVTNSERQYALLVGVVAEATRTTGRNCLIPNYTKIYYDSVDNATPLAWYDPVNTSIKLEEALNRVRNLTDDLRDLIDSTCEKAKLSRSNARTSDCNYIIDIFINDHPKRYSIPARLLLALGPLSNFYLKNNNNFQKAADSHSIVHLMLDMYPKQFIDLLPKAGQVYRSMTKLNC